MDHTVCMHVFTALPLRWNDIGEDEEEELSLRKQTHPCTCDKFEAFLLTCTEEWMSQKIWKETKHLPGTAEQGNILCCCLVSLRFLCDIHSIHSARSWSWLRLRRGTQTASSSEPASAASTPPTTYSSTASMCWVQCLWHIWLVDGNTVMFHYRVTHHLDSYILLTSNW